MKLYVINKLIMRNFKTTLTLKFHHIFNTHLEHYVHAPDDTVFYDHSKILITNLHFKTAKLPFNNPLKLMLFNTYF